MDISSSTTSVSPSNASGLSSAPAASGATSAISSDFETFLKMLTAQIENQDPMNPMESTDFATQLATFSSVEQQVKTNDLLTEMLGQSDALGLAQMAHWIGKSVRVATDANYEGRPISVWASPLAVADHADLVISDSDGTERNRLRIPATEGPVEWVGVDANGVQVAWGSYSLAVESIDENGTVLANDPAEIYAEVVEARTDGTTLKLLLPGGAEVDAAAVSAIRAGDAPSSTGS